MRKKEFNCEKCIFHKLSDRPLMVECYKFLHTDGAPQLRYFYEKCDPGWEDTKKALKGYIKR